jgi:hypothetical protein
MCGSLHWIAHAGRKLMLAACALCADCARYRVHALVKAWHHIPFWHAIFAGPQAHVAFAS